MKLAAVVVAAGLSRRMGREKILLPFGGSTVLETVLAKIARAAVDRAVVVLRPDLPEAERLSRAAGVDVVINREPGEEMLHSIRLGLEAVSTAADAFYVWPADHPAVAMETLARLAAAADRGLALIPVFEGRRGHPALLGADLARHVASIPAGSGLRALWRDRVEAVREIAVDDPGVVEDLDDPAAWERAVRRDAGSRAE